MYYSSLNEYLKSALVLYSQLILTPQFPFKLNGKVMQVLISIFLYHDFSVRNFIKGVQVRRGYVISTVLGCIFFSLKPFFCCVQQLALLEHFHSQPLSVLCCTKKEAVANAQQLSHKDLERIRQLQSFKRWTKRTRLHSVILMF